MIESIKLRAIIVGCLLFLALLYLVPTIVPKDDAGQPELPGWWVTPLPKRKMNLGLDLKGGIYLVYTVKFQDAIKEECNRYTEILKDFTFKDNAINTTEFRTIESNYFGGWGIRITFASEDDRGKAEKEVSGPNSSWQYEKEEPLALVLTMVKESVDYNKKIAIEQVIRTLSKRVDEWNVAESSITIKGSDQIVVELPGEKDPKRIDDVIGKTAKLEFKIVQFEADTEEGIKAQYGGKVPDGMSIVVYVNPSNGIKTFMLLKNYADMKGEALNDARVGSDDLGAPAVDFTLKPGPDGASLFRELTSKNRGKRLAIVLDGEVRSAPNIRGTISSSGQITGQFDREEAFDLAVVLRSGSLPVSLEKDFGQVVGASLGTDLIRRGKIAAIVGGALVIIFLLFYYRLSGVASNIALIVNIVLLLGVLAGFGATLTLPGIAGIVLTIGIAVDANVLIFERIREELRTGKAVRTSVDTGFSKALVTILDANITTLIATIVLYQYGSGPIKGFAVTLSVGILTSVFTAVFVTKLIFDWYIKTRRITVLSI